MVHEASWLSHVWTGQKRIIPYFRKRNATAASACQPPAIDDEHMTVHVVAGGGCQEDRRSELISRRPDPNVIAWIDGLDPDTVYLSVITIGEIQKGVEKLPDTERKQTIREWLHNDLLLRFQGRIIPITASVALMWGTLTAALEQNGRSLSAIDALVAAIAREGGYVLITRNVRDFAGAGITVINPRDEG